MEGVALDSQPSWKCVEAVPAIHFAFEGDSSVRPRRDARGLGRGCAADDGDWAVLGDFAVAFLEQAAGIQIVSHVVQLGEVANEIVDFSAAAGEIQVSSTRCSLKSAISNPPFMAKRLW
jgi:chorismate synthase